MEMGIAKVMPPSEQGFRKALGAGAPRALFRGRTPLARPVPYRPGHALAHARLGETIPDCKLSLLTARCIGARHRAGGCLRLGHRRPPGARPVVQHLKEWL